MYIKRPYLFKILPLLLLIIMSITAQNRSKRHIIFDLGGVLFKTNRFAAMKKLGISHIFSQVLLAGKDLQADFMSFLNVIKPNEQKTGYVYDEKGQPLPEIFCDFLRGAGSHAVLRTIGAHTTKNDIFYDLASMVFDPATIASIHSLIPAGRRFVERCVDRGYSVYILSNWDPESFFYLQERYAPFFNLFSGIVISGDCGFIKPDPAIFRYALTLFGLCAQDCLFIDNQQENVQAASALGMDSILVKKTWLGNPDFSVVERMVHGWHECSSIGAIKSTHVRDENA